MNPLRQLLRALALLLALGSGLSLALEEDRDQPIEVIADRALRDDIRGYTVYSGAVRLTQGSLVIEADKITIFHATRSADRVVGEGQPARMQQQQNPGEAPMHAQALRIIYLVEAERILLRDQARVEQGGAVVNGDTIDYLIPEQVVRADTESGSDSRVQVVIPAERINSDDSGNPDSSEDASGNPESE